MLAPYVVEQLASIRVHDELNELHLACPIEKQRERLGLRLTIVVKALVKVLSPILYIYHLLCCRDAPPVQPLCVRTEGSTKEVYPYTKEEPVTVTQASIMRVVDAYTPASDDCWELQVCCPSTHFFLRPTLSRSSSSPCAAAPATVHHDLK